MPNILLHQVSPAQVVSPDDVHFAFASGRLTYDCIECGAKCCRGFGYRLASPSEAALQLRLRPSIRFFLTAEHAAAGPSFLVQNCASGCFFLTDSGFCQIQEGHGYSAKPETCRLFPFNRLSRVGRYLVVAPHLSLCPLTVTATGPSPLSDHTRLRSELASNGVFTPVPSRAATGDDAARVIALERTVVSLSEQYLAGPDIVGFASAQMTATEASFGRACEPGHQADAFIAHACRALRISGAEIGSETTALARTLIAATPSLRHDSVFVAAGSAPDVDVHHVVQATLALYLLARLACAAGTQNTTFQGLHKLFATQRALVRLLAYSSCSVSWRPGASIPLPPPNLDNETQRRCLRLQRAVLQGATDKAVPLGALLEEFGSGDHLAHVRFLQASAAMLAGRVGVGTPRESVALRRRVRSALQRWSVLHLRDDLLCAVSRRLRPAG